MTELFSIHHSSLIILHLPAISTQETNVRGREATKEWEDRREVCVGDAVPMRERRRVLIDRGRRDPTPARVGIVGAAERKRRVRAVEAPAQDCAAHDELMIAPTVI